MYKILPVDFIKYFHRIQSQDKHFTFFCKKKAENQIPWAALTALHCISKRKQQQSFFNRSVKRALHLPCITGVVQSSRHHWWIWLDMLSSLLPVLVTARGVWVAPAWTAWVMFGNGRVGLLAWKPERYQKAEKAFSDARAKRLTVTFLMSSVSLLHRALF